MLWLAREYQQRLVADPSLTLEDFSAQYAVSAHEIRAHIPELNEGVDQSVVL